MTINDESKSTDAAFNLRDFLIDMVDEGNLPDPYVDDGNTRHDADKYVWVGEPDHELNGEKMKLPAIILQRTPGGSQGNMGTSGSQGRFSWDVRLIHDQKNYSHKRVLDKAIDILTTTHGPDPKAVNSTGTNSRNNSYDLTPMSNPECNSPPHPRGEYSDHGFGEQAADFTASFIFGSS